MDKIETLLSCLPESPFKQRLTQEIESLRAKLAEAERKREALMRAIVYAVKQLEYISCPSQTDELLWWQLSARLALGEIDAAMPSTSHDKEVG